jgi:hypothetical protein
MDSPRDSERSTDSSRRSERNVVLPGRASLSPAGLTRCAHIVTSSAALPDRAADDRGPRGRIARHARAEPLVLNQTSGLVFC